MVSECIFQQLLCLMIMVSAEIRKELYTIVPGYRLTNTPLWTMNFKPSKRSAPWCLQHCLTLSCSSASFSQTEGICELHSLKLYDGDSTYVESNDWIYMEPRSGVLSAAETKKRFCIGSKRLHDIWGEPIEEPIEETMPLQQPLVEKVFLPVVKHQKVTRDRSGLYFSLTQGKGKRNVLTWDGWTVVFRAQKDTGTSSYTAWLNDSLSHDHALLPPRLQPGCLSPDTSRPCGDHFRSKIVSAWETAGIQLVKVQLMKNSRIRREIIFNGTGTTKISWFTKSRVVNSTWTDLKTSHFNIFSIKGHSYGRRFMVSNSYWGCTRDVMWMMVIDGYDPKHSCEYDRPVTAPKFLYTLKSTKTVTGRLEDFEYGDAMAILVKMGN